MKTQDEESVYDNTEETGGNASRQTSQMDITWEIITGKSSFFNYSNALSHGYKPENDYLIWQESNCGEKQKMF